jgi:hypothetical protein
MRILLIFSGDNRRTVPQSNGLLIVWNFLPSFTRLQPLLKQFNTYPLAMLGPAGSWWSVGHRAMDFPVLLHADFQVLFSGHGRQRMWFQAPPPPLTSCVTSGEPSTLLCLILLTTVLTKRVWQTLSGIRNASCGQCCSSQPLQTISLLLGTLTSAVLSTVAFHSFPASDMGL